MASAAAPSAAPSIAPSTGPSAAPSRDPNSEAIWSPDTPEYIPQYTCQYGDEEAEQEAGEMQLDSNEEGEELSTTQASASKPQHRPGDTSSAYKQAAYGSGSVAPFAQRRTGK